MKKLIVLLLAFALVGAVFAEDKPAALTFGSYMEAYGDFTQGTANTLYNETYLNYSSGGVALSATVVAGEDLFAQVRNYALSYQLMPAVKVYFGRLRETGGARLTSYIDGNGFSTRIANVQNGLMFTAADKGFGIALFSPLDTAANTNFGASVSLPNVAKFVGGYRGGNGELWVGADVSALKNVTARVGYKYLTGTKASYVYATVGSSKLVKDLDLGVDANIAIGSGYGVKGKVEYSVDPYAVGVLASYDNGSDTWYKNGGFNVNPYVKLNYAQGDVCVGISYDVASATFGVPFYCELWY